MGLVELPAQLKAGIEEALRGWTEERAGCVPLGPVPVVGLLRQRGWRIEVTDTGQVYDAVAFLCPPAQERLLLVDAEATFERTRLASAWALACELAGHDGPLALDRTQPGFVRHYEDAHLFRAAALLLMPDVAVMQCRTLTELALMCRVSVTLAAWRVRWTHVPARAQYVFNESEWIVRRFGQGARRG